MNEKFNRAIRAWHFHHAARMAADMGDHARAAICQFLAEATNTQQNAAFRRGVMQRIKLQ